MLEGVIIGLENFSVAARRQAPDLALEHREYLLRLAKSMLRKRGAFLPEDELNSLVNIATCEAAASFDPSKGTQFTTFAYYYLKGHLSRTIAKRQRECVHVEYQELSKLAEHLVENQQPLPDAQLQLKQTLNLLHSSIEELSEAERIVISRLFIDEQKVAIVAEEVGYTRTHVWRLKSSALRKLKTKLGNSDIDQASMAQPTENSEFPLPPRIGNDLNTSLVDKH